MRASLRNQPGARRSGGSRTVPRLMVLGVLFASVSVADSTTTTPPAGATAVPNIAVTAPAKSTSTALTPGKPTPKSTAKAAGTPTTRTAPTVKATTPTASAHATHAVTPPMTKAAPLPTTRLASSRPGLVVHGASSTTRLAVTAVKPSPGVQPLAHLDEHLTYQYNTLGRRDPFQPLVGGDFVGADVGGEAPPDIGGIKVVGIVWGVSDQFAMVEDARGNSMVLRVGDKVMNGVVEGLRHDALIVNLTTDGQSQQVVIPLTKKGDQNATH